MKRVHFTLGGKGGVGKSFVSSLVTQYLRSRGDQVRVIDTDPVNATMSSYPVFAAERLPLMEHGVLDERQLDRLIDRILVHGEQAALVIDSSAAAFAALGERIANASGRLAGRGVSVMLHTLITGGQVLGDTLAGLASLIEQMPEEVNIVVWLNAFFGEIRLEGQLFEQTPFYTRYHPRLYGLVWLERQAGSAFSQDIQRMLARRLSFAEVAQSDEFDLSAKSRIAQVRNHIFEQLALIL